MGRCDAAEVDRTLVATRPRAASDCVSTGDKPECADGATSPRETQSLVGWPAGTAVDGPAGRLHLDQAGCDGMHSCRGSTVDAQNLHCFGDMVVDGMRRYADNGGDRP